MKYRAGWLTNWNQDCWEKYQQPQICRWYHSNGKKWKCWFKTQRSTIKDHGIQSHHFMANRWGKSGSSDRFYFLGLQNHCSDCSHEIKTLAPWKKSHDQTRQPIKEQRHHLADKGPYSESYGFPSTDRKVGDHKEGRAPKNWHFQIVVLKKTLETTRRSKQSILKEINPEYSLGGLMLKLKR